MINISKKLYDTSAIMYVIGCLIQSPKLLSEVDKVKLVKEDFDDKFTKSIFLAIYNLYLNGANKITPVDVEAYLKQNDMAYKIFKDNNGFNYLMDAEELSDIDNFKYYYTKVKKFSALRDLEKNGYSIKKIYDDEILTLDKQRKMIEEFDRMSLKDIFDTILEDYSKLEADYVGRLSNSRGVISDGMRELQEQLKKTPEVGFPLQGEIFNTIIRGARKTKLYIRSGSTGSGKSLVNGSLVLTPKGYKKIEELALGEEIFGEDGKIYNVEGVFPQGRKQVYEVEFSDRTVVKCCSEHLWSYQTSSLRGSHSKTWKTKTLEEIIKTEKLYKEEKSGYKRWNIYIPMSKPFEFEKKELLIPPYTLGALLGDGCLRSKGSYSFSNEDLDIVEKVNFELKTVNAYLYKKNRVDYEIRVGVGHGVSKNSGLLREILISYGLDGTKSNSKFIPDEYKHSCIEDRIELLKGLIDTDGTFSNSGYEFATVSERLCDDVKFIVESLGMTATKSVKETSYTYNNEKKSGQLAYRLYIKTSEKIPKIHYSQKREKQWRQGQSFAHRTIREIRKTDFFEEMTCIKTSNPTELFITNNCIVTHNTRLAVGDACGLAFPERYSKKHRKWVRSGFNEKVLFVTTEMSVDEIQTMIWAYLADVNEEKILFHTYEEDEEQRVAKSIEIAEKYKDHFFWEHIPDPTIEGVSSAIRSQVRNHKITHVFYDYIFSSPSLLREFEGQNIREDVILCMLATKLKDLANELDVFIETSTQLNASWEDAAKTGIRNQNMIRGSKAIIDKGDVGCITLPVMSSELEALSSLIQKQGYSRPTHVTDVYKLRRGRYKNTRIWSVVDLGTCRMEDIFATDEMFNEKEIPILKYSMIDWSDKTD